MGPHQMPRLRRSAGCRGRSLASGRSSCANSLRRHIFVTPTSVSVLWCDLVLLVVMRPLALAEALLSWALEGLLPLLSSLSLSPVCGPRGAVRRMCSAQIGGSTNLFLRAL